MNDGNSTSHTWEEGTIKIPNPQWKIFKAKINRVFNPIVEKDFYYALKVYELVMRESKGKRKFSFRREVILRTSEFNLRADSVARIENSMFPVGSERKRPLKPKKKNFLPATNRTSIFELGNSIILLSNKNKTFGWVVKEGVHAVEEAHSHPVAAAAFQALSDVDWNRNSGGVILSNKPKETEAPYKNSPNIAKRFGPLGEKGVLFGTVG